MEAVAPGRGLYLKPYKLGLGLYLKPYPGYVLKEKKIELDYLPNRPLTNIDIIKYAHAFKILNFLRIFMRNKLPAGGPLKNESAVVNIDDAKGVGTYWVCYKKLAKKVWYFDSFGDLQPRWISCAT